MILATLTALTNIVQVATALCNGNAGSPFDIHAFAASDAYSIDRVFSIENSSGAVIILPSAQITLPPIGSRIHVLGEIEQSASGHLVAKANSIRILSSEKGISPVRQASLPEVLSGACDARIIKAKGMLRDFFLDEIDPQFLFLILNDKNSTLYVAAARHSDEDLHRLNSLIGCQLTVTGLCDPSPSGSRRMIGRIVRIMDISAVVPDSEIPRDPFSVPAIRSTSMLQPTTIHALGRQRISGHVLAVWGRNAALLRTELGSLSRIDLSKDNPPKYGDFIEAAGFPETDLYRINLTRAIWRSSPQKDSFRSPIVTNITATTLMTGCQGKSVVSADLHGRTVRLRGIVRSLPSIGDDGRFYLESDGYTLPVDISANPALAEKLEIGSVIDLTGVCVMDIENWRPNLVFPHIKEVMIVTRTPGDIVVVRHPPWWTPARLMIVIGSLLAVLIGILIWNRALKALAERRGKALANEELERLESDLKVCERTRLAVELHDSIAQNLTGVSMEIDTALRGNEPLPSAAAQHMGRALRTIDSCRGELRNCLWDLRSQALEEDDMNEAIRLTLSQTIGKANLSVRFNVPRSRFTDNTAHTLLRIIRELTANAVRHGKATEIKVAGSIEDNVLKFSVRDNGCGFDPDACPGVLDGHFGLQGVRERVASFEGDIQIESALGKGTRVSVSINAPQTDDKEKI